MKSRVRIELLGITAGAFTMFAIGVITAQEQTPILPTPSPIAATTQQPAAPKADEKIKSPFLETTTKNQDGETKGPNLGLWEKEYPIKIISVTLYKRGTETKGQPPYVLKVLCRYTEDDMPDLTDKAKGQKLSARLNGILYFFDEETVLIGKANHPAQPFIEGELTGVKGDNFRYCIPLTENLIMAKRVELREK